MTKPTYEELQAQIERLRDAANRLSFGLVHDEPEWNPSTATSSAFSELQDAISETPAQSLAALKAQWQAEAIKRVMRECDSYRLQEMPGYGIMVWDIEEILKELDGTQEPTND